MHKAKRLDAEMQSLYLKISLFGWFAGYGCRVFSLVVQIPLFFKKHASPGKLF